MSGFDRFSRGRCDRCRCWLDRRKSDWVLIRRNGGCTLLCLDCAEELVRSLDELQWVSSRLWKLEDMVKEIAGRLAGGRRG